MPVGQGEVYRGYNIVSDPLKQADGVYQVRVRIFSATGELAHDLIDHKAKLSRTAEEARLRGIDYGQGWVNHQITMGAAR